MNTILVIGGGAAGMMAAVTAGEKGARVVLIERMRRVGKKLLATGNGRCNLTNTNMDTAKFHGCRPEFVTGALEQFGVGDTLAFFERLGVTPRIEEDGKVFPASYQASSVLDVMRYAMDELGVNTVCDKRVSRIQVGRKGFECLCTDSSPFTADRVILAAGGCSAPNLGSNGGGVKIAQSLGHSIVEPFPALVQVNLDSPFLKRLKGLKLNGQAAVSVDGKPMRSEYGELLFTEYGLSGLPILQLSRIVSAQTGKHKPVTIQLDLFPDRDNQELLDLIITRFAVNPGKPVDFSFVGLLHKRLIPVILQEAGIEDLGIECGALSEDTVKGIASRLKAWRLTCTGVQSWMQSQVTAGGVDVNEVNETTLESKLVPGVFLAGEVLDIDGDSGGYNLQWAWSSGHVAGTHAAA